MWKVILFLFLILIGSIEVGRTIGIRNYILGNATGEVMCYFTLKGKYEKEKLIQVLDSYEIFNYRLFGTRLVKMGIGMKSYDLGGSSRATLLSIRIDQARDDYTLNITFHHGVFDMQYIMEILDAYLRNDSSPKPLQISKSVYLSDVEPSILKPWNYLRSVVIKREKIVVTNEDINGFRASTGLSSLDIVFAILGRKYLMDAGKTSCILSIIRSTRTQPNDKFRIGNMVTFHNVKISGRDTVTDIADRIRKSYSKGTTFSAADVVITSWVPHKGFSHLYPAIKSNGRLYTSFRPRLYHKLHHQQISVSKRDDNYLCDIHRSSYV